MTALFPPLIPTGLNYRKEHAFTPAFSQRGTQDSRKNMIRKVAAYLLLALVTLLTAAGAFAGPFAAFADPGLESASPSITLSPATALPNQSITVTGKDFTTGGGITISSITIGGNQIPAEKINFGSAVDVDNGGNFVANVIIPVNSTTLDPGSYSVAVTDSAGAKASASLAISTPTLSVSPSSSRVGSTITITGAKFPSSNGSIGADSAPAITIEYEVEGASSRSMGTVFPNASGGFTTTFEVPLNIPVPSKDNTVRALITGTSTSATALHTVPNPTLAPSPAKGAPGTSVTLKGSDFKPFSTVTSLTLGGLDVAVSSNLHTDAAGGFTTAFVVPEIYGGAQPLSVHLGGSRYTVVFQVEANALATPELAPPPRSFNPADALDPLGDNLLRVFHFDNATKEWAFYDPRPDFASASTLTELVEGQAYWIEVKTDQTAILGGKNRTLIEGWNLVPW